MDRGFEISGGYNPEREAFAAKYQRKEEKGKEHIAGELEKTPELLATVNDARQLLKKEFENLGLPQAEVPETDRVHYFDAVRLKALANTEDGPEWHLRGWANTKRDAAYISFTNQPLEDHLEEAEDDINYAAVSAAVEDPDFDKLTRGEKDGRIDKIVTSYVNEIRTYDLLNATIHEMLHMASFKKYYLTQKGEKRGWRAGFDFVYEGKGRFLSMNEAITEKMSWELVTSKMRERRSEGLDPQEDAPQIPAYDNDREILEDILARVAEYKKETVDTVWKRFKKSYLTGELMHLRDIERAYGKDALKLYALLTPNDTETYYKDLVTYFTTKDLNAQNEIKKRLFDTEEKIKPANA